MTENSEGQAYDSFNSISDLEKFVLEQAKKNRVITEVVYGDGKWYAVATHTSSATKIECKWGASFPSDWVEERWKEDMYINKITYG
ncbi:MAG TPA: hypothetical protein VHN59_07060, partial [Chitinophagaceae bacterium]|nr:hypothetical protein [Chitinophagaceae bacterium]